MSDPIAIRCTPVRVRGATGPRHQLDEERADEGPCVDQDVDRPAMDGLDEPTPPLRLDLDLEVVAMELGEGAGEMDGAGEHVHRGTSGASVTRSGPLIGYGSNDSLLRVTCQAD